MAPGVLDQPLTLRTVLTFIGLSQLVLAVASPILFVTYVYCALTGTPKWLWRSKQEESPVTTLNLTHTEKDNEHD